VIHSDTSGGPLGIAVRAARDIVLLPLRLSTVSRKPTERRRGVGDDHPLGLVRPASFAAQAQPQVRTDASTFSQLHWTLDVGFHEDQSRIRQGYAAENFAVLRHLALILLQQRQAKRLSMKGKRLKAGWDSYFLPQVPEGS
jgi:hypothetical protein